ncbi:MAG TPA: condensation domain-containing protein, partial [Herpetosiphonaceae bacterium]
VAYVVEHRPAAQEHGSRQDLRTFLQERLPAYMVPSAFVVLEALPLTPNGKVDRKALPRPEYIREDVGSQPGPRTPLEEVIAGVWSTVLAVESIGIDDNFFALGGHSLRATQVVTRLRQVLGHEVPLRLLFEAPTVAGLTARLTTAQASATLPLVAVPRDARLLPLSFAQQRFWFLDQVVPDSPLYAIPLAVRLHGALDHAALERSISTIVARHEVLRTALVYDPAASSDGNDLPMQRIAPVQEVRLPLVALPTADDAAVRQAVQAIVQQPFDFAQGPLWRVVLVQQTPTEHLLVWVLHHSIFDGWSQGVLLRELSLLYRGFVQHNPVELPPLPIQYADYAVWQRQWLAQGAPRSVLEQQLAYWRHQLADVPPLDLPTDHPRPALPSDRGGHVALHLPAALTEALHQRSQQAGVTLFMTLLAAWQTVLARYSGQTDIAVGTPIAGRVRPELEHLIGCFVNTLVLRTDLAGNPSFAALLERVRTVCLDAYAHQDLPFELLVERLQPERDLSRTPLFQSMLTLQNTARPTLDVPGLTVEPLAVESTTAKFDLSLTLVERADGLHGVIEYRTALFAAQTIERLGRHFVTLVEGIVAEPEQRIAWLPLLSAAERHQLIVGWNATEATYPQARCLHQLVEAQAARTPDALAVVGGAEALRYRELNARANRLAHYLREHGVGPDRPVAVALPRS